MRRIRRPSAAAANGRNRPVPARPARRRPGRSGAPVRRPTGIPCRRVCEPAVADPAASRAPATRPGRVSRGDRPGSPTVPVCRDRPAPGITAGTRPAPGSGRSAPLRLRAASLRRGVVRQGSRGRKTGCAGHGCPGAPSTAGVWIRAIGEGRRSQFRTDYAYPQALYGQLLPA